MYTEDVEWCYRIQKLGWKILFDPTATIAHVGHGSAPDSFTTAQRKRLHREGVLRFTELHPSPWFWALRVLLKVSLFLGGGSDGASPSQTPS